MEPLTVVIIRYTPLLGYYMVNKDNFVNINHEIILKMDVKKDSKLLATECSLSFAKNYNMNGSSLLYLCNGLPTGPYERISFNQPLSVK